MEQTKVVLADHEIPTQWYNIQADLPKPMSPPLHPGTGKPVGPDDLAPIFPMNLIEQEVSQERWIDIPDEVLGKYLIWRPSPLCRARNFEKILDAPVKIYYKYEGSSPAGSHKPNTAIPQAYYNKVFGVKRLSTETGAGQWGSALSMACAMFGLELRVFMVKVSYEQKPYRRMMMNTWGATCFPSPSNETEAGRQVLAEHPDSPGSLGIAISEAVEDAVSHENSRYSQRGQGVYARSIDAIRALNGAGYGVDPDLDLSLVFNPGGPFLPPPQKRLDADYRAELERRFGIRFSRLIVLTNMPLGRFRQRLEQTGELEGYLQLLAGAYNPATLPGLMCRHQICIDWDGTLFDCDFNLALGMSVNHGTPDRIDAFTPAVLKNRKIVTDIHCFGCTAGAGSSCSGALTEGDDPTLSG